MIEIFIYNIFIIAVFSFGYDHLVSCVLNILSFAFLISIDMLYIPAASETFT